MKKTALRHLLATVAGLTTILLPISVLAAPGDLYEADRGTNTIFRFTPNGTKNTFAGALNGPIAVAFDGSGNVFEADFAGGAAGFFPWGLGGVLRNRRSPRSIRRTVSSGLY